MPTSETIAISFIVVLALFTAFTGMRSLTSGRVCMVPAEITRKERFSAWLMGVIVQLITAIALGFFASKMIWMVNHR